MQEGKNHETTIKSTSKGVQEGKHESGAYRHTPRPDYVGVKQRPSDPKHSEMNLNQEVQEGENN